LHRCALPAPAVVLFKGGRQKRWRIDLGMREEQSYMHTSAHRHRGGAGQHQGVDPATLMGLDPIGRLNPEAVQELCCNAQVRELVPGGCLFILGREDRRVFYLLEGQVELSDAKAVVDTVVAGTAASRRPLAPGRPRRLTATAKTRIRYLTLDADLLDMLSGPSRGQAQIEEILADEGPIENQVFYQVYHDYMADRLEVPSLPDLAIRIRIAVQKPEVGLDEIARIVQVDPSLVAHLVRIANSPLYAASGPVRNIRGAIVRTGIVATRDHVTAFTLRHLFKTRYPALKQRMRELWQHSCMVGAIACVMARQVPRMSADQALLAGLVHDIGTTALMRHMDNYPALLAKPRQLEETVQRLRGQVGAMVLRKWGFSDELVNVALEAENWQRDAGPKPDLCDLIILAQLHSLVGRPEAEQLPPIDTLPAFRKLDGQRLAPEQTLELLQAAKQEVAELRRSLSG
jgi:putative nucleotidyltransferase with HDIG domain